MIHATPPIDANLADKLNHLDELRTLLRAEAGRATPWNGQLRREALIEAVTSSAAIEGYVVEAATAASLLSGAQPHADEVSQWAVSCYGRAMEHIGVMSDDPSFRWLDRVVLDLHFDACAFQRSQAPGRWRTGPVYVTDARGEIVYESPDAAQVPPLMAEVIEWLEHGDLDVHVAVRAAMAHLHIVSVHPFRDGNGRISRLVQSLVLARDGLLAPSLGSIEPYFAQHTLEYYELLQAAHGAVYDPALDARPWVEFCVDAHIEQATARVEVHTSAARRWRALAQLAEERAWPDRLVIALEQALAGRFDRASYVAEADVSAPTANLDFRRLLDAGLIQSVGTGRQTHYVATTRLRGVIDRE